MKRTSVSIASVIIAPGILFFLLVEARAELTADLVYYNGKIVTANANFEIVQAVAVKDGRIISVGTNESVKELAGTNTQLVDLKGKTVLPGFYNSHVHLGAGNGPNVQDWTNLSTREAFYDALRERAAELKDGEWVHGVLSNEHWPPDKLPNRWDIDQVVPDVPVVVTRGPHVMVVNSLGLKKAGITRATPQPGGGKIEKNENGEPTGWLREGGAWRLVWKVVPESPPEDETARTRIRNRLKEWLSVGITSVNVAGVSWDSLRWFQQVCEAWGDELPRLTVQIRVSPGYDRNDNLQEGIDRSIKELENLGFYTGFGNECLQLGAVKMSIDGGLSGEAFWSLQPYPNRPDYTGLVRIPEEAFYAVAKRAHDLGWQLGIHTIGDAAVVMVVDQIEKILKESPREDHRHYLHHVSVLPPQETLKKMARLGIAVSSQPNFIHSLGAFAANSLRDDRLARNNPQRSLAEHEIHLAYGSDHPPTQSPPLFGIWTAVTRTGFDGKIYGADEGVSVEEAIKSYTLGTSYLTFDEDERGSLEVGKVADMVVLSEDILSVDPNRIKDIQIEKTIVGGKLLYSQ